MTSLSNRLNGYFYDQADIAFLEYVKKIQDEGESSSYRRKKSLIVIHKLGYGEERKLEFEYRCDSLIKRGYLTLSKKGLLTISKEGVNYLTEYYRYQKLRIPAKVTKIIQQNFSAMLSVLAIILSASSLMVSIFH